MCWLRNGVGGREEIRADLRADAKRDAPRLQKAGWGQASADEGLPGV